MSVQNTAKEQKSLQHTLVGRVVSNKMDKTVTVLVERASKHPIYGKYVVRSNKYHAHDETNAVNEGDLVEIAETRPLSRDQGVDGDAGREGKQSLSKQLRRYRAARIYSWASLLGEVRAFRDITRTGPKTGRICSQVGRVGTVAATK